MLSLLAATELAPSKHSDNRDSHSSLGFPIIRLSVTLLLILNNGELHLLPRDIPVV